MMCQLDKNLLQEYIDGSIGPLEKLILTEHLNSCANCRQELNQLKIIDWDLSSIYAEEVGIPTELSSLRKNVLASCFKEEVSQNLNAQPMTTADIWQLQAATFNNSWKFLRLMPRLPRAEKTEVRKPRSKASLLRKIIGL